MTCMGLPMIPSVQPLVIPGEPLTIKPEDAQGGSPKIEVDQDMFNRTAAEIFRP